MSDEKNDAHAAESSAPGETVPSSLASGGRSAKTVVGTGTGTAAVEVELVHEVRRPPYVAKPWRMLEIWTQNRIYGLDSSMHCLEVLDQTTGKRADDHTLLGAHLVGGQRREGDTVHLCHPFPQPGTEAVFEQGSAAGARFSHSSTVTRVILRLRTLTISAGQDVPSWQQVCADWSKQA